MNAGPLVDEIPGLPPLSLSLANRAAAQTTSSVRDAEIEIKDSARGNEIYSAIRPLTDLKESSTTIATDINDLPITSPHGSYSEHARGSASRP